MPGPERKALQERKQWSLSDDNKEQGFFDGHGGSVEACQDESKHRSRDTWEFRLCQKDVEGYREISKERMEKFQWKRNKKCGPVEADIYADADPLDGHKSRANRHG